MRCIIIEDQPPAQRILKKYINDIDYLDLVNVFSNAVEAISFLNEESVDLIFLDIHLPKISGLDFLKSNAPNAHVILTTAFSEYALESYEYKVLDYLLKPFSFQRLLKALSKIPREQKIVDSTPISHSIPPPQETSVFIKTGYEHIKVLIADILYIKSDADYTELITAQKKHLSTFSLRYWQDKFEQNNFCQIHKSYVINANHIEKVSSGFVTLNTGDAIPIGRVYKDRIKSFLEN